jgi:phage gpG-like protein
VSEPFIEVAEVGVGPAVIEMRALMARAADIAPVLELLGHEFEHAEADWFSSHGEGSWPPLASATRRGKERRRRPTELLVDSGRMLQSLTEETDDSISYVTPSTLVFGTRVPYARYHRDGTTKMPQRDPLIPALQVEPGAVNELARYIVGRFGIVR